MRKIGITGGVGCGKSEVMHYLEEAYAAVVLRSDEIARELMEPGGACFSSILSLFGTSYLTPDGFDRKKIAEVVFHDPGRLEEMNAILHPAVWQEVRSRAREEEKKGTRLFCMESALLGEKDNETFDELWYVYADEPTRRARLRESRGYSEEKISAILKNQHSDAEFRRICDVILDNSGSFAATKRQIDALLGE